MGFFDNLGKAADKFGGYMSSDRMKEKMMDGYMKGKISDESMEKYEKGLQAYDKYKANKNRGNR